MMMKDFHKYNRKHLRMILIAMALMALLGSLSGCRSYEQCPQTYGYDNYKPQPNKF
jgi:hypothetical protein